MTGNTDTIDMDQKNSNKIIWVMIIVLTLLAYGAGLKLHYQPDLYMTYFNRESPWHHIFFDNGRIVSGLIFGLMKVLNLSYPVMFYITLIPEMFFSALAVYRLYTLTVTVYGRRTEGDIDLGRRVFIALACWITIANLFSAESFLYPVWFYYTFSVWIAVEAVRSFVIDPDSLTIKRYCVIVLLLITVTFIYQTNASVFVILCMLFVLSESDDIRKLIKRTAMVAVLYGLPMILQVIYVTIVTKSARVQRSEGQRSITETAAQAVQASHPAQAVQASGAAQTVQASAPQQTTAEFILGRIPIAVWIYAALCLVIGIALIVSVIRLKKHMDLIKGVVLVLAVLIMGFLPYIAKLGADYVPRVYYPAAMLLGVLIVYAILNGYADELRYLSIICMGSLVIMTLAQWISFTGIFITQYMTDYSDRMLSQIYGQAIEEYEMSTGNDVSKVVFYEDASRTKYLSDKGWCLSERGYSASWSRLYVINLYLDENYSKGTPDDDLTAYFSSMNWDRFSSDQIRFIDDTVHICVY